MSEMLYMYENFQNIACSQRQTHTCIHHSVIHDEHTTSKKQTDRQTDRQTNRQAGRQAGRQATEQADRQTERHTHRH